jgi:hypothetical protein
MVFLNIRRTFHLLTLSNPGYVMREGKEPGSRTTHSTNGSHSKSDTKTEVLGQSVLVHDEMAYQPYM